VTEQGGLVFDIAPSVLAFPDRKTDGRYPVTDSSGAVCARIQTTWTGTEFLAVDAGGQRLCRGQTHWFGFPAAWQVTGPDDGPLLSVTGKAGRNDRQVHLERGGDFIVRSPALRRRFTVTDAAGVLVLTAVPQTRPYSFHQWSYLVTTTQPTFRLSELVAVVQSWRMIMSGSTSG
jgi:hypothetical protein